jgi:hypothetical protein
MSDYCSISDVQALTQLTYSSDTEPTSTQVSGVISQITGEIDVILASLGVTSQPTDSNVLNMLKLKCAMGVAGLIGLTYYNNPEETNNQMGLYWQEYKDFLTKIQENPQMIIDAAGSGLATSDVIGNQVTAGYVDEDDILDNFTDDTGFEY